jgi:hypothetical protein
MRSPKHFAAAHSRWRASLVLIFTALALALPAGASAAAFTARLHAPNHSPTAGKKWPITVTATRGRTKLGGSVRYQFLFGGQVVSSQPGHSFRHGVYHDNLLFPADAVGEPLTLRVIVKTKFGTADLNWAVEARH